MRLQHMLDLMSSQLQIRNIVEFHFGAAENLMRFSLCKIFFGRNCSTPRITVTSRHWFLQFYCRNSSENDVLFREISSNQKRFAMWKLFMCFTVNGWDITIKPVQNVQRPGIANCAKHTANGQSTIKIDTHIAKSTAAMLLLQEGETFTQSE